MSKKNDNKGFIGKIIVIVIALVFVKYAFHFDVLEYLKTPEAQKVIGPIWTAIKAFYAWADNLVRSWTS